MSCKIRIPRHAIQATPTTDWFIVEVPPEGFDTVTCDQSCGACREPVKDFLCNGACADCCTKCCDLFKIHQLRPSAEHE